MLMQRQLGHSKVTGEKNIGRIMASVGINLATMKLCFPELSLCIVQS